jgi:hypothetical protein
MRLNFKKHRECLEDYMAMVMLRKQAIEMKHKEIKAKIDNLQQHISKVGQQHEWVLKQLSSPPEVYDQDILKAHQANVMNLKKLHKQEIQSFQDIIAKHVQSLETSAASLKQIDDDLDSQH